MAEGLSDLLADAGQLVVVEPESAACVAQAMMAGRPVLIKGDLHTSADMLSCGLASAPALEVILRRKARSVVVREDQLRAAVALLRKCGGPSTTPSGAAGLAGLMQVAAVSELCATHQLCERSTVLLIATEGPIEQ